MEKTDHVLHALALQAARQFCPSSRFQGSAVACKDQRFVSVPRPSLTSFEDPVLLSSDFFFFMERGFGPLTRLRFRGPGTVSCPLLVTCSGCGASAAGSSASGEATASAFSSCRRAALCSRSFKCSLSASLCTPWKKHR